MARSTDEWIGATDDTAIPPRIRLRIFQRAEGRCEVCTRKLMPGDAWQADHIVALVNGGANRESNLRCICDWCHKAKTRADVAEKSRTRRVQAKHAGVKSTSRTPMPFGRQDRRKRKVDGTVVDRVTGELIGRRG